jgi:hydrogenase maturation protease HycI
MFSDSWKKALQAVLRPLRQPPKTVLIGIGSELHGDDSVGLEVVRALRGCKSLILIEAGTVPENHTGTVRRLQPDLVIMIDAVQMQLAPGEIRMLDVDSLEGIGANTHTLPLALTAHFITAELGCEVVMLGIQPACTDFGAPHSPLVFSAVEAISRELRACYDER